MAALPTWAAFPWANPPSAPPNSKATRAATNRKKETPDWLSFAFVAIPPSRLWKTDPYPLGRPKYEPLCGCVPRTSKLSRKGCGTLSCRAQRRTSPFCASLSCTCGKGGQTGSWKRNRCADLLPAWGKSFRFKWIDKLRGTLYSSAQS